MALTKIKRGGLDTGITDNSDANALTFDSSENATFTGTIYAQGSGSATNRLQFIADTMTSIGSNLVFATDGGTSLTLTRNDNHATFGGNVGIGGAPSDEFTIHSSSGSNKFHINADGSNWNLRKQASGGSSNDVFYGTWDSTNVYAAGWLYVNNRVMGASGDIRVGSNDGNEMLHLLADGTAKIDTAGTTAFTLDSSQNATFVGDMNLTTANSKLGIGKTASSGWELDIETSSGNANARLKATGTNQGARLEMDAHSGDESNITFASGGTAKAQIASDVGDQNIILKTGGTTTALTINSSQNATFAGVFKVDKAGSGDAIGIFEDPSGNANVLISATASNKNSILNFGDSASAEIGQIDYDHNDNSMKLVTDGTTALTLNSSQKALFAGNIEGAGRLQVAVNLDATFAHELFNGHSTGHGLKVRGGSTSSHYALYVANYNQTSALLSVMADGSSTFGGAITIDTNSTSVYPKIEGKTSAYTLWKLEQWYANEGFLGIYNDGNLKIRLTGGQAGVASYINNGANFGIGTSNPDLGKLYVYNDSTTFTGYFQNNQGDGHCMHLKASASDESASENMFKCSTDSASRFEVMNSGKVFVNNSEVHSGSSDERVKKNIVTMTNVLDDIDKLRGVTFNWKEKVESLKWNNPSDTEKKYGMIAQEVEEVWSELVSADDNGVKNISYEPIIAILLQGMKELSAKVTALENA